MEIGDTMIVGRTNKEIVLPNTVLKCSGKFYGGKEIEREVTLLWVDVSAKEKKAYSTLYNNVIGYGNTSDYMYNTKLLEENKPRLYKILNELDLDKSCLHFYDLLYKNDGSLWTEFHQKLDFLASMLNAADILEYEEQPVYYLKKQRNPKIKILTNKK